MIEYRWETPIGMRSMALPPPTHNVVDGVQWGAPYEVPSAAYWAMAGALAEERGDCNPRRVGSTLQEQYAYCLLGGYGMPAEVGESAFYRLGEAGMLNSTVSAEEIEAALREPLCVRGRMVRYRFPQQKARYLAAGFRAFPITDLLDAIEARKALLTLPGVGLKTASWIVRDWYGSDDVAILDVHIIGVCRALGVFRASDDPVISYLQMERRFLDFSNAISVRPSVLDNLMWQEVRATGLTFKHAY